MELWEQVNAMKGDGSRRDGALRASRKAGGGGTALLGAGNLLEIWVEGNRCHLIPFRLAGGA